MERFFNVSSSPHIRGGESTRSIMYHVVLALTPAAAFGVYRFGIHALGILLISMGTALFAEAVFQYLAGQKITVSDGSALVTGMLLGMNLPPTVPLWIPILGSLFAVVFVKQIFGGIGQNFMNPAMAARCFLLISFTGIMSNYAVDGISGATPLAALAAGERVGLSDLFFGMIPGTIGEVSALATLAGGAYLLVRGIITWEIPGCYLLSFAVFEWLFASGERSISFVLAELLSGGLLLGAFFMATDYVTSPITKKGKIIYGMFLGILTGILRTYGTSPEGVSYAIIIGNLLVPLIEKVTLPTAFGYEAGALEGKKKGKFTAYRPALLLTLVTLVSGLILGSVYQLTRGPIEKAEQRAKENAFSAVMPEADTFVLSEDLCRAQETICSADGSIWNGKYGSIVYGDVCDALDEEQNRIGFVINVTSKDGFGGDLSISVGITLEGIVTGVEFLEINETAGLGMRAKEKEFYGQFSGVKSEKEFCVTKEEAKEIYEIEAISGATVTSKAVTSAVNAAKALAEAALKQGGA